MIRVLITGCSMHSYDLIRALKDNYDGEEIYVVGINCDDTALLRKGVDAGYGAVRSFMSTLYWIIHNTPEDVIFIADDDIEKFVYRMSDTTYLELPDKRPDKERVTAEIERIAQLIYDLGIGYAFDQPTMAPYAYDCEFKFVGMPGHIRWINKKALKATYDPDDPAASDVDMMMQELLHNRIILQPRYLCAKAGMDLNEGASRTREGHMILVEAMKNKWGKYYDYNYKRNFARIMVKR